MFTWGGLVYPTGPLEGPHFFLDLILLLERQPKNWGFSFLLGLPILLVTQLPGWPSLARENLHPQKLGAFSEHPQYWALFLMD